jgi:DNA-binding response OmpR family regulator
MPLPVSPAAPVPPAANAEPAPESQTIVRGSLRLDLRGYAVALAGRDIEVTVTEFLLLKALAQQPYRVLDRAMLAHAVYAHGHGQAARPMSPRAVDLHISRLRRKLSRLGCDAIKTMRFVGYRFVPPNAA